MGRPYFDSRIKEYGGSIGYEGMNQKVSAKFKVKRGAQNAGMVSTASSNYNGSILPRGTGPSAIQIRNKFQKNGAVYVGETHGYVKDADNIAIGHTIWHFEAQYYAIAMAMVRKLIAKMGIVPDTPTSGIEWGSVPGGFSSGPFFIYWKMMNGAGVATSTTYPISTTTSLYDLVKDSKLYEAIQKQFDHSSSGDPPKIQQIFIFENEGPENHTRIRAQMNLKQERLELTSHVQTTIQNRTSSAAGSLDTETVDAQPLKGPAFNFHSFPKTKNPFLIQLNKAYKEGVILFRKAELAGSNEWKEVPVKNQFNNVKNSTYVRLSPGQIKDFQCQKTYSGLYETLIDKLKVNLISEQMFNCPGPAQIVFLEEEMNTGSANHIVCGYETQHTVGASFSTSRLKSFAPYYNESSRSNLPA